MSTELALLQEFSKLFFPKEIADNFIITKVDSTKEDVVITLEEKNVIRQNEDGHTYSNNGFYEASPIRDFPLRERKVTLLVKRRRWIDTTEGKSISNDYELAAKGTRHSVEFAAFLKEALGQIPDYGPLS